MEIFCSAVAGYLVGGFNPSYLIAQKKGFDIRKIGSGNAGASNAILTMGKSVGLLSALIDILKAFLIVKLMSYLFPVIKMVGMLTGAACILGHIFPVFLKFRGGKGLACLGGTILAFDWRVFLILLAVELVIAFLTDYICFVPITAAILFPAIYGWITRDIGGVLCLSVSGVVIISRHVENIKRIRRGTEAHFSFLWRKDKEMERLRNNGVISSEKTPTSIK